MDQISRDDRIAILTKLDRKGVLQVRKGIDRVAARLGISRVTPYSYLDEARNHAECE
ncbi:helix-turn-helix domain-containing protein [Sinomonas sp. ASV486]|uniref:helix-turn-helix domain-containing protein n=1 Tax=Sinomonas sp. ASV486 TaxID=3051170 RepID=UPI0035A729C3